MLDGERAAGAEFDRWADDGKAEAMESGHGGATRSIVDRWTLGPASHVLDVGCGNGWAVRLVLERGAGQATGIDVSERMIARASEGPGAFLRASAGSLPFEAGTFSHVLSIENLYYVPDVTAALAEWVRVAAGGARLGLMVDLYAENPASHGWRDLLPIPVHILSVAEYTWAARQAGWREVTTRRFLDPRPLETPDEFEPDAWCPDYDTYKAYKAAGSLIIEAAR